MRQTADREKKEEAELAATMGKVDKEVGGRGRQLGCLACCTGTVAETGCHLSCVLCACTATGCRMQQTSVGACQPCADPANGPVGRVRLNPGRLSVFPPMRLPPCCRPRSCLMQTGRQRRRLARRGWGSGCGMQDLGTTTMPCTDGTTTSRRVGTAGRQGGTRLWQPVTTGRRGTPWAGRGAVLRGLSTERYKPERRTL